MMDLTIKVREGVCLSNFRVTDKSALLEQIGSKESHDNTLTIPHPYLKVHAEAFLQKRIAQTEGQVKLLTFAIRDEYDKLIGGVGCNSLVLGTTHVAELGYWLGVSFWGRGIVTDALRAYVGYAFNELELFRLTAHAFESNIGSRFATFLTAGRTYKPNPERRINNPTSPRERAVFQ